MDAGSATPSMLAPASAPREYVVQEMDADESMEDTGAGGCCGGGKRAKPRPKA
jgi:hypothetical protein